LKRRNSRHYVQTRLLQLSAVSPCECESLAFCADQRNCQWGGHPLAPTTDAGRRRVERADFMAIVALDAPDFHTISEFRRCHLAALWRCLCRCSSQAVRAGWAGQARARGAKHKAMSYERMGKRGVELQAEVDGWLKERRTPARTRRSGADGAVRRCRTGSPAS
jgi:hypothetical protein